MIRLISIFLYLFSSIIIAQTVINPIQRPFALVELFTSQGCSSCPSAHKVVENIYEDPIFGNDSVLILSFHVDYWNDLGWIDPFSQKVFTQRQSEYQILFGSEGVYTPEFVVNGRSGFSGNNEPRLRRELKAIKAENKARKSGIELTELRIENEKLVFAYSSANTDAEKMMLHVAIIGNSDSTFVTSGENADQTLLSKNTVLAFLQLPYRNTGSRAFLNLPRSFDRQKNRFVIWIQDTENAQVLDILIYDLRL
jgi:hypothetical protein